MKKMHEKRNEKKSLKNNDNAFIASEKDEKPLSTENFLGENILSKELTNPKENSATKEKTLRIVNGKVQIAFPDEPLAENTQIITVESNKGDRTTSMSYRHRNHTEKWSPEDTKKFFRVRLRFKTNI